jgi:hypothetical protein
LMLADGRKLTAESKLRAAAFLIYHRSVARACRATLVQGKSSA